MTAFEKRKEKQDLCNNGTSETADVEPAETSETSTPLMATSTMTDDNIDSTASIGDEESSATVNNQAAILKRYKIERKNSQQLSHNKLVPHMSHRHTFHDPPSNCLCLLFFFLQLGRTDDLKDNESKFNSQAIQNYANTIQTMINDENVCVKIADLGNACFDVSYLYTH